jgi:hypothetical protein
MNENVKSELASIEAKYNNFFKTTVGLREGEKHASIEDFVVIQGSPIGRVNFTSVLGYELPQIIKDEINIVFKNHHS